MTLRFVSPKSNGKVMTGAANFYAGWRNCRRHLMALHEQPEPPDERLLQAVWHHQRLRREALRACDGRALRVLHPGFLNREAGPDFRQAVLQFEGEAAQTGDVEVDIQARCWRQHGHDRNPAFGGVILHVVWDVDTPVFSPTLSIQSFLDAPLLELASWLGTDAAQSYPEDLLGRCARGLKGLAPEQLHEILRQAALARLQSRANDLEARARQAGWEQALWERMLRALGYKHNTWPMLRLGELRPLLLDPAPACLLHWQARLFGVSGLLPPDLGRAGGGLDAYLRRVWDIWWRERHQFSDVVLPASAWRLHGLRPANHPLRRLALAAHWWASGSLPARLDQWMSATLTATELAPALLLQLHGAEDDFWSWHWALRGRRLALPQPLAGPTRITDLAVNVLLPWFWARARQGNNPAVQAEVERRYFAWPAAQDNSVLRLARRRLLGMGAGRGWNSAARQQGLLQIVRDFCDHSDPLCRDCPFPECVASLARPPGPGIPSGNPDPLTALRSVPTGQKDC